MFESLKKAFFQAITRNAREIDCPSCKLRFKPFAGQEVNSWAEFNAGLKCPRCGQTVTLSGARDSDESRANPDGPFEKPPKSRIERREVSETELLYYFPPSGTSGGLMFFAIFWNLISWTVFSMFLWSFLNGKANVHGAPTPAVLLAALFPTIGIFMAYAAIRTRFAKHLLYISPDIVRLQRALFFRKTFTLPASEVLHVKKTVFYTQNYQPVYGIEFSTGSRKIRFGSVLSDDEKNWVCWDARQHLRKVGAKL